MQMKILSPKGKYKDENTYEDVITYVTRADKCPSGYIITRNVNRDTIAEDMATYDREFHKREGCTKIRHAVISFEDRDNVTLELAADIAGIACDHYKEYPVVAAVHEDTDNLHIHMVMGTTNVRTGKKYTGRKKDYYDFQNELKNVARKNDMKYRNVKYSS